LASGNTSQGTQFVTHAKNRTSPAVPIVSYVLMEIDFFLQVSMQTSRIQFHKKPSNGSQIIPLGRTNGQVNIMKLIGMEKNGEDQLDRSCEK
jgi:hypothetical protein